MKWYDWLIIAAVWSLIPLAIYLKRRQDREHAKGERQLEIELQTILGTKTCCVCAANFRSDQRGNTCMECRQTVCMWCCDRVGTGNQFVCTRCSAPGAA